MTFDRSVLCVVAAAGFVAAPASAQYVFGDFEGSDPGVWGYWDGGVQTPLGDDPSLEYSTADSTTGSTSVLATNPGYDQNLAYAANTLEIREAFMDYDTLLFDVVFPEYSTGGYWELFEFVMNSNAGFSNLTSTVTNSEGGTNQIGWGDDGGPRRVVTFSVDYSSEVAAWGGTAPNYLELVISLNNDGDHTGVYLDNFRLVPAPGAAAALAIGLGGLGVRRRR